MTVAVSLDNFNVDNQHKASNVLGRNLKGNTLESQLKSTRGTNKCVFIFKITMVYLNRKFSILVW